MLKVIDRFTTKNGSWEPNSEPFSITAIAAAKYGDYPGKGGANHIHVKAPIGLDVQFDTEDRKNYVFYKVPESGWINHPMAHSSSYVPARGERGPWIVWVNGTEVARGIGLPDGLHVATFLIVKDVEGDNGAPVTPDNQWIEIVARTMVDGLQESEEILWTTRR